MPADPAAKTLVQREDSIYFEHLVRGDLAHVVNLPQDFPYSGSKVTYEGEIEPPQMANTASTSTIPDTRRFM